MNDAEQINKEILEQWITGRGKHPVTWKTLTQVLHDIELSTLAEEIEAVKCHANPEEENNPSNYPVQDASVQRGIRDIITAIAKRSEQRNLENAPIDIDDDKYYEAVQQVADFVCRCVHQLQNNQNRHPR